jgi:hypothetical protein
MRRHHAALVITFVVASGQACFREAPHRAVLRTGAASVCHGPPLLVSARPSGDYTLNARVFDSAGLVSALHHVLSPRPEKVVMVKVDSSRTWSLRWIVGAIEANGGSAFAPDSDAKLLCARRL